MKEKSITVDVIRRERVRFRVGMEVKVIDKRYEQIKGNYPVSRWGKIVKMEECGAWVDLTWPNESPSVALRLEYRHLRPDDLKRYA